MNKLIFIFRLAKATLFNCVIKLYVFFKDSLHVRIRRGKVNLNIKNCMRNEHAQLNIQYWLILSIKKYLTYNQYSTDIS